MCNQTTRQRLETNKERNVRCVETTAGSDSKRWGLRIVGKACEKVHVIHMQMEWHVQLVMSLRLVFPSIRVSREERPSTTKRVSGKSCTCLCNCRLPMGSLDLGNNLATTTSRELLWETNQRTLIVATVCSLSQRKVRIVHNQTRNVQIQAWHFGRVQNGWKALIARLDAPNKVGVLSRASSSMHLCYPPGRMDHVKLRRG